MLPQTGFSAVVTKDVNNTQDLGERDMPYTLPKSPTSTLPSQQPAVAEPIKWQTYFISPLTTIIFSLDGSGSSITHHDLIEAYNVFSHRIKAQIKTIIERSVSQSALGSIRENSATLAQALRRDIRLTLGRSIVPEQEERLSEAGQPSTSMLIRSDDDIHSYRSMLSLSHHALRLLSDIFTFEALYSCFSAHDLRSLFSHVVSPVVSGHLRGLLPPKTRALIIWTLKVQQLPLDVLDVASLTKSLTCAVTGDMGGHVITDALEASARVLRRHPEQSVPHFANSVTIYLQYLLSDSEGLRTGAAEVLCAFALAKMHSQRDSNQQRSFICEHVLTFIDAQTSRKQSLQGSVKLPSMIATALNITDPKLLSSGPIWALSVLASFIILVDYRVFTHPRLLKLALPSFAKALVHKRSVVRHLHPHLWKTLVWALACIPHGIQGGSDLRDLGDRAFLMVKQEMKEDIGTALVIALTGYQVATSTSNLSFDKGCKALQVLQEMVLGTDRPSVELGTKLLNRLLGHSDVTPTFVEGALCKIVPVAILDGTFIRTRWEQLPGLVRSLDQCGPGLVRSLSETEISQYWNLFVDIWLACIKNSMDDQLTYPSVQSDLLQSWQSLLLAKAQLTQEMGHLAAPSHVSSRLILAMSELVSFASESSDPHLWLDIVANAWGVIKNVFASSWLCEPAESVLAAVLQVKFDLSRPELKESWSRLCANLISTAFPSVPRALVELSEGQAELELQRSLWNILAKVWRTPDPTIKWEDIVCILLVPLCAWQLSDLELSLYDEVLRAAISTANASDIRPTVVVEHLLVHLNNAQLEMLTADPKIIIVLASHVSPIHDNALPSRTLILLDNVLVALHPPTDEQRSDCIKILKLLQDFVLACPACMITPVLLTCKKSLCRWIANDSEVLQADEYNDLVMPIYCHSLDLLKTLPPSVQSLTDLSVYLASAFSHVPKPALGPMAFQDFWKATYHGIDDMIKECPEDVKQCLRAIDEAYGGNLAVGFSIDTDSDLTTPRSVVSDSQPSRFGSEFNDSAHTPIRKVQHNVELETPRRHSLPPPLANSLPRTSLRTAASEAQSPWFHGQAERAIRQQLDQQTTPGAAHSSSDQWKLHASKRIVFSDDNEGTSTRRIKRRRTEPAMILDISSLANITDFPLEPRASRSKDGVRANASTSRSSSSCRAEQFQGVEVPSLVDVYKSEGSMGRSKGQRQHLASFPDDNAGENFVQTRSPQRARSRRSTVDDYDSWEVGITSQDIDIIRQELGIGQTSQDYATSPGTVDDGSDEALPSSSRPASFFGDVSGVDTWRSKAATTQRGKRSHTEPVADLPSSDGHEHNEDGGNIAADVQSPRVGLRRSKTTSARLDALEHAYAVVTDDVSQVQVEDLAHAAALVHQIGDALNQQMMRKLARR